RITHKPLVAALTAFALLAAGARAGDSTEARGHAQQLVEGQQSTIAFFMHPTATLKAISCDRTEAHANGDFTLEYTFRFRSWYRTSFWSKIRFRFYANGGLDQCAASETNAWVRPFTAANLLVGWLKGRLASHAGSADSDQMR